MDKVTLIIIQPSTNTLQTSKFNEEWQKFFDSGDFKNRVLFLTSHRSMRRVIEQTRQYKQLTLFWQNLKLRSWPPVINDVSTVFRTQS
jgi:hypothetical protein